MNTSVPPTAGTRPATKEEIEHAAMVLRSLGRTAFASLIEKTDPGKLADLNMVAVAQDFSNIPSFTQALLIPPGTHQVPQAVLDSTFYLIGLAWKRSDYPVLSLQPEPANIADDGTPEETQTSVHEVALGMVSFAGVALDAPRHTVLQVLLGDNLFSDRFFNVKWRDNVDALDVLSGTLYNGREWAIDAAYGPDFSRGRNAVEKGLDAFHEGGINLIDGIFRPLVRWGEKVDRALGLN